MIRRFAISAAALAFAIVAQIWVGALAAFGVTVSAQVPGVSVSLAGLSLALAAAWFLVGPRTRTGVVSARMLLGGAGVMAVVALADRWARFRYALMFAVLIPTALLHLEAALHVLIAAVRGRERPGHVPQLACLAAATTVASVLAVTRLSELGAYQPGFKARGAELTESVRAGVSSDGFRGPRIPVAKRPGVMRVAVLGDSSGYGWMVSEPESFPRRLEQLLGVDRVEVLNASVPGYDVERLAARYVMRVRPFDPDVVLLLSGPNETDETGPLQLALQALRGVTQGRRLVMLTYPSLGDCDASNATIVSFGRAHGVEVIDLDALPKGAGERFFLFDRVHPSPDGHRLIAETIARRLLR